MDVYLLDGTYELFRHFYGAPEARNADGEEVGAVRGVLASVLRMFADGVTHLGVATDHVVDSFRNELWAGYKTGEDIDPALASQFPLLEEALTALGVVVWPMVELEADDALATAAERAFMDPAVERVFICTPDKDLAQCVLGDRVVQFDRRRNEVRDAVAIEARFGVPPASIPDYLALVGDSADGFPGLPGWGAKSAAAVLGRYGMLEAIPGDVAEWDVTVRGAAKLAATFTRERELALRFRELATLRTDADVFADVAELRWRGPTAEFAACCDRLGVPPMARRAQELSAGRT